MTTRKPKTEPQTETTAETTTAAAGPSSPPVDTSTEAETRAALDEHQTADELAAEAGQIARAEAEATAGPDDHVTRERTRADGETETVTLYSRAKWQQTFCQAFDAPQAFHPAFRHIATDAGPYRRQSAEATASAIYDMAVDSGQAWLQNLLKIDGSGLEKVAQWGMIGWFGWGTVQGARTAMAEIAYMQQQAAQQQAEAGAEG